jgi:anti-sigma factor RsiW
MTDDIGTHIASDEELLSKYALGRLLGSEQEKVDRHTAGCPACMEALRREMRVAAGARKLGREDLKAELKRRIAAPPVRAAWPRIVSVAAAISIIAGLGVYYAWFTGKGSLSPPVGGSPPLAGRTESLKQDEGNAPARELAERVTAEKPPESPAPAGAHAAANQEGSASHAPRSADNNRRTEPSRGSTAASSGAPMEEPGGGFWSDGIVERAGGALDAAAARGGVSAGEKTALLFKSKALKKEADQTKDALQGQYLLRQKPASALTGSRERSGRDQQTVPTRVDQRGSTTTMTLYLDSLLDENDLKRGRVEAVSDDSVVVTLGGTKILYRFPPGQGAQQQRQK